MVSFHVPLSPVLGRSKPRVLTTRKGASALAEPLSVSMVTALPSTVAIAVSRWCSKCFLGHVLQIARIFDDCGVPGIVLDQAQYIRGVNVAVFCGLRLGNYHFNVILQEGVAVVGTDFGNGVGIVLQTLYDNLAGISSTFHGMKWVASDSAATWSTT